MENWRPLGTGAIGPTYAFRSAGILPYRLRFVSLEILDFSASRPSRSPARHKRKPPAWQGVLTGGLDQTC